MKNQDLMTPPKNHNNLTVTHPKDIEICNLHDKEFKIDALRKPNELQENKTKQKGNSSK